MKYVLGLLGHSTAPDDTLKYELLITNQDINDINITITGTLFLFLLKKGMNELTNLWGFTAR